MMLIRHCLVVATLLLAGPGLAQNPAEPLPSPEGEVKLVVSGQIAATNQDDEAHLDLDLLETLPRHELTTSTSVTDGVIHFEGFLVRDLLEWLDANGETAVAIALNDYIVEIPLQDFYDYDVILATHMDDQRLTRRDKGPLWIVYPRDDHAELQDIRYDYRWVWQLHRLEIE
ncbi:molybdopterin-dependent oxidoreductase [Halomonas daqiaonensis]|nr:molybdopterin-dependent oxidoreductase [Halomonas daqiaonensis]